MVISMKDEDGESVRKICNEDTWMDVVRTVIIGLKGFGYFVPEDKERFFTMLSENMEENE